MLKWVIIFLLALIIGGIILGQFAAEMNPAALFFYAGLLAGIVALIGVAVLAIKKSRR